MEEWNGNLDFLETSDRPVSLVYCFAMYDQNVLSAIPNCPKPVFTKTTRILWFCNPYLFLCIYWWHLIWLVFCYSCITAGPEYLDFLSVHRTVRTWDVNSEKQHKSVFKPRSSKGKKVVPTCCTYSRDGKLIAAGCQDGTIQIWDRNLSVSPEQHTTHH